MKLITKAEYLKAARVVHAYQRQQTKGKYQFLYWEDASRNEDDIKIKWVKAAGPEEAVKKFKEETPLCVAIDMHIMLEGGEFYDIRAYL